MRIRCFAVAVLVGLGLVLGAGAVTAQTIDPEVVTTVDEALPGDDPAADDSPVPAGPGAADDSPSGAQFLRSDEGDGPGTTSFPLARVLTLAVIGTVALGAVGVSMARSAS